MADLRHLVRLATIVLFVLTTLVVADGRFKCGFEVCNENDFCVEAPLIGQDESPYCVGCDSKQDLCDTEKQQSGCKLFCEEYVARKHLARDCRESYDQEFHIGKDEFIVSIVGACIVSIVVGALLCHAYHTTRPWTPRLAGTLQRILNCVRCGEAVNQAIDKGANTVENHEETSVKMPDGKDQTTESNVTVNTALLHETTCRPKNIIPTSPAQPPQFAPG